MLRIRVLSLAGLFGVIAACLAGVSGRGGFEAVAVSPDGKVAAVGGQNRVVYLVDTATGQVSKRIWLGARIGGLGFNRDGTRLIVEVETAMLRLIDTTSGKTLQTRGDVSGLTLLPDGERVLVRDEKVLAGNRLLLLSLDRLSDERILSVEDPPAAWTVDAEGKVLTVLGRGVPTPDERRVALQDTPAGLVGLDRASFRLKNDGLRATLRRIDLASGKIVQSQPLWYSSDSDSTLLIAAGRETFVFNRLNVNARINASGEVSLFRTPYRVNTTLGASADGKVLAVGGLAEGGLLAPGSEVHRPFTLDTLPGQSETISRFAVAADGSAWAVTTAYRLVHISAAGKVDRLHAIY